MRFHSVSKFVLPLMALAPLSGCFSYFTNSGSLSTGYKYANEDYKLPPAAQADEIGYEYSADKNAEMLEIWRPKVQQLLSDMENKSALRGKKIYVRAPFLQSLPNASFDHILREELIKNGYEIVSDHYEGVILAYAITEPEATYIERIPYQKHEDPMKMQPKNDSDYDFQPMILSIAALDGVHQIAETSGVFVVPMYGYKRDHGGRKLYKNVAGQDPTHRIAGPENYDLDKNR